MTMTSKHIAVGFLKSI